MRFLLFIVIAYIISKFLKRVFFRYIAGQQKQNPHSQNDPYKNIEEADYEILDDE